MGSEYQYRGDLASQPLAEVLFTIYHYRVPGVIQAVHSDVLKRIYVKDGHIVHASTTDIRESLGCYLLNHGLISRHDFRETMRLRRESSERYGVILVEEGLLSPAELYKSIRLQTAEIVWELFGWSDGQISFTVGEFNEPSSVFIQMPLRQAIKDGLRRTGSGPELLRRVGSGDTVLEPAYDVEAMIELALRPRECELLSLVDGQRTLDEICDAGPFALDVNQRLLYAYEVLKFVRQKGEDSSAGSTHIEISREPDSSD